MIIQFSRGGGQFIAGKAADNTDDAACIAGCVAGALHVREVAKLYGVPVILHTDHCMRSWLPWFDGLLDANEDYFKKNGEPLFSSHMLDLSEEPLEENIATCVEYLERMSKMNILLEMELGVTGGEEDGVDNSDVDSSKLYTQPEEVYEVYKALKAVEGGMFTVAAAFGNVHGVYAPGNVKLTPQILHNTQAYISEKEGLDEDQAGLLRLPRRLGLVARGHPLRDRGGHHQDEHRHRHAVVVLGRHPPTTTTPQPQQDYDPQGQIGNPEEDELYAFAQPAAARTQAPTHQTHHLTTLLCSSRFAQASTCSKRLIEPCLDVVGDLQCSRPECGQPDAAPTLLRVA